MFFVLEVWINLGCSVCACASTLAQIQFIGTHAGDEPPLTNPSHIFQSAAGFLSYFVVMGENGFLPYTLIGLRERWEDPTAIVTDSYGQDWVRICWSLCQNFINLF